MVIYIQPGAYHYIYKGTKELTMNNKELKAVIEEARKQERLAIIEEIKELCIPLDLISNNKGIALTLADLELLKQTSKETSGGNPTL